MLTLDPFGRIGWPSLDLNDGNSPKHRQFESVFSCKICGLFIPASPPKKTFNFPAKMEIHSISPFQIFHRPGLGIELSTCLDDTYWSTLDAKAGRLRPDHFLRTFPLTRSGKTRDGPMEMKMFKTRCPEIAELVWEWFVWFLMWALQNASCVILSTPIASAYKCACNKIHQSGMFQPDATADVSATGVHQPALHPFRKKRRRVTSFCTQESYIQIWMSYL